MQELQKIEFFQLRPSSKREKNIAKLIRSQFEKRKTEAEKFQQKIKRIRKISEKVNANSSINT
ncbi:MAG TPA: hypothetical protein PLX17_00490 [Chitinophagaceae bacterium]|nr:hypothetical protein [Chitinophagaceae bacterium]